MEELKKFMDRCFVTAKESMYSAEYLRHQAYGAAMFYLQLHPEDFNEVADYWELMKEKFAKLIYNYYA